MVEPDQHGGDELHRFARPTIAQAAPATAPVVPEVRSPFAARVAGFRTVRAAKSLVLAVALVALVAPIPSGVPGPFGAPAAAAAACTGWASTTEPPPTIRVLRSTGPAAGTVQQVPFRDYVNVVMAAEWGPSQPTQALEAGAVAVKQYGWQRAMIWRGGTADDGSCYDVVDTWADQVYAPETRTPAPSQVAAVDATWDATVLKAGEFIATHYQAGDDVPCGTNATGWWLYQISAVACARDGMLYDAILQTYYGPDAQVVHSAAAAPGPAALLFVTPPSGGTAGAPFPVQPSVAIVDGTGQIVTTGDGSTLPVTLALAPSASGAVLTCTDGTTRAAAAGIATFAGCASSAAGADLVVTATAPGLAPATAPIAVAPATPSLAMTPVAATIAWGNTAQFTVTMTPPPGGPVVAGRAVRVERSINGSDWVAAADLTTDATGAVAWTDRQATNMWYRATFAGAADLGAATSDPRRVVVRQIALLRPANRGAVRTVARGAAVTFTTTIRPARPELAAGRAEYQVWTLRSGRWALVRTVAVTADASGRAVLRQAFTAPGRWRIRAHALPTTLNANSIWSPFEDYLVR